MHPVNYEISVVNSRLGLRLFSLKWLSGSPDICYSTK